MYFSTALFNLIFRYALFLEQTYTIWPDVSGYLTIIHAGFRLTVATNLEAHDCLV